MTVSLHVLSFVPASLKDFNLVERYFFLVVSCYIIIFTAYLCILRKKGYKVSSLGDQTFKNAHH